jgi:hypothetical protein
MVGVSTTGPGGFPGIDPPCVCASRDPTCTSKGAKLAGWKRTGEHQGLANARQPAPTNKAVCAAMSLAYQVC